VAPGTAAVRWEAEAPGAAVVAADLEVLAEDHLAVAERAGVGEILDGRGKG
jgi:hypothetical protein